MHRDGKGANPWEHSERCDRGDPHHSNLYSRRLEFETLAKERMADWAVTAC